MRPVIKAYEGKNIPIEYGKQEAESKRRFIEEWRNPELGLYKQDERQAADT